MTTTTTTAHTCHRRTDGAGSVYFTTSLACPACPHEERKVVRNLSDLETRLLDEVPSDGWTMRARNVAPWWVAEAVAAETPGERAAEWTAATLGHETVVIAWVSQDLGTLDMGVVRGAQRGTHRDGETWEYFEASPFPGAWTRVTREEILTVRHAATL